MPPITRTAEVKTRTSAQIKADAAAVYARWGISLSDAINIFLTKSIEVGDLPFDMRPETPTFDGLEWSGLVLWTGCFEGCWLLLVVLCPLARVLVG